MKSIIRTNIFLFVMVVISCNAGMADKVFYVRFDHTEKSAQSQVIVREIKKSHETIAVPNKCLPQKIKGAVESASPSKSGRYLLLKGYPWHTFRNKRTGQIRTSYGNFWSSTPSKEDDIADGGKGIWYWDQNAKKAYVLIDDIEHSGYNPTWAPYGDDILFRDNGQNKFSNELKSGKIEIFRLPSKKRVSFGPFQNVTKTTWSGDGNSILMVVNVKGKSLIQLQSLTGKLNNLFTWPRIIWSITQSPKNSSFVILDETGLYITNRAGKHAVKLPIVCSEGEVWFNWQFKFNSSGSKLAIFSDVCRGNPHVFTDYTLYIVDMYKRRLSRNQWTWSASFQGSDIEYGRYLDGWMPDNKTVRIGARVDYGFEKPAGSINDWVKIWKLDISRKSNPEVEIFDSSKKCMKACWWSGK
jgi:hypothetical protein